MAEKSKPRNASENETPEPVRPKSKVLRTRDGRLQACVMLADGTFKRLPAFDRGTSRAYAAERAAYWAEEVIRQDVRSSRRESAAEAREASEMGRWVAAWVRERVARGQTSTRENASHYRIHIQPSLGPKHVRDWTRDDLRKLSRDLDAKIRAKELSWKSAWNVWGTATRMCSDAAESKHDAIRCRPDNPATDIRGPDRGDEKAKEFLYPSELRTFVSCGAVPRAWRRLVALATYTYLRAGELTVLEWPDVELEHGVIRVHRARNRVTGDVKGTKGRRARSVPIEPTLLPLLRAMHREAGGVGRVVAGIMPGARDLARGLRRWLKKAKVLRAGLHTSNETQRSIVFHDLRATGLTWMAVRGDDPLKIQYRAGHTDLETTQRYIRLAELVREGFGQPFPELPSSLYTLDPEHAPDHSALAERQDGVTIRVFSGADGTRTRGLRRDRPAL